METSLYLAIYKALISSAFYVVLFTFLGYSFLAPWFRSTIGRLQWFLWLALLLVLLVPYLQINYGNDIPFRREFSIAAMFLFNAVILFCGYSIYRTQIKAYLKKRKEVK